MESSHRKHRMQTDIRSQLKCFLKVAKLLRLTTFTYDPSKRRVTHTENRFFRTMLLGLRNSTGAIVSLGLVTCICGCFMNLDRQSWQDTEPIVVQEFILLMSYCVTEYVCFGLLAHSLLEARRLISPVINEMLKIYAALEKRTDSKLVVPRHFNVAVTSRAFIMVVTFSFELVLNLILSVLLVGVIQIFGTLLTAATLIGHLYSQLVLIGFYSKMAKCLQGASLVMGKEECSKNVQKLLAISFRLHRVKTKLNTLSSAVFVTVFFGLSFGIFASYTTWKQLVSEEEESEDKMKLLAFSCWLCINFVVIVYDLYLICSLSDELVARERRFMRNILLLICANKLSARAQASWEINQIMIRSEVFKLKSMIFLLIDLDKPFVLSYLYFMVVQYVIMCMQYYIREQGYN